MNASIRWAWLVLTQALGTLIYWVLVQTVNLYSIALVGALYEMFWLFAVILLFTLPVGTAILWRRSREKKTRLLYAFAFLLSLLTPAIIWWLQL